jgi:hypothetical protein
MEQPLNEMSHTHRDLFGFSPPPSMGRTQASTNKKCYNYIKRGYFTYQCRLALNCLGSPPSQVGQHLRMSLPCNPKNNQGPDVIEWKFATLEEMYPKDDML